MPYENIRSKILTDRSVTACFTGHRPDGIPLDMADPHNINAIMGLLYQSVSTAYKTGYRIFITGLAEGIDSYAALAVEKFRDTHDDVRLVGAVPYRAKLGSTRRESYVDDAYSCCNEILVTSEENNRGVYHLRDRFMVDQSSYIIAALAKNEGGSKYTFDYAVKRGLEYDLIDLNKACAKIAADRDGVI